MKIMAIAKKVTVWFQCERCPHEWIPRNPDELPEVCPKCKSPYWNKPREKPTAKQSATTRRRRNGSKID